MNSFIGSNALLALVVLCWSPATSAQPINSTAPGVHAATGMTFPARIGVYAKLIYSVDRGRAGSQPDLAWYYAVDTPLGGTVTVYISNLGQTEIPTGPDSPLAKAELDDGVAVVTQMLSRPLQTVKGPTECTSLASRSAASRSSTGCRMAYPFTRCCWRRDIAITSCSYRPSGTAKWLR